MNEQKIDREFDNERYQIIRSMIRHEDDLISSRTGWMIACQALLITSIGLGDFEFVPKLLVCTLGIVVSWQSMRNLVFAEDAIFKLKNSWTKADRALRQDFPDVIGVRGPEVPRKKEKATPPVRQAIAFLLFWVLLATYYSANYGSCHGYLIFLEDLAKC